MALFKSKSFVCILKFLQEVLNPQNWCEMLLLEMKLACAAYYHLLGDQTWLLLFPVLNTSIMVQSCLNSHTDLPIHNHTYQFHVWTSFTFKIQHRWNQNNRLLWGSFLNTTQYTKNRVNCVSTLHSTDCHAVRTSMTSTLRLLVHSGKYCTFTFFLHFEF